MKAGSLKRNLWPQRQTSAFKTFLFPKVCVEGFIQRCFTMSFCVRNILLWTELRKEARGLLEVTCRFGEVLHLNGTKVHSHMVLRMNADFLKYNYSLFHSYGRCTHHMKQHDNRGCSAVFELPTRSLQSRAIMSLFVKLFKLSVDGWTWLSNRKTKTMLEGNWTRSWWL